MEMPKTLRTYSVPLADGGTSGSLMREMRDAVARTRNERPWLRDAGLMEVAVSRGCGRSNEAAASARRRVSLRMYFLG